MTVYRLGDKLVAARSNEFGYANYEVEGSERSVSAAAATERRHGLG